MNTLELGKHGLKFGQDLIYEATFIKGKKSDISDIKLHRLLFRGSKTGKKYMLFIGNLFNRYTIQSVRQEDLVIINETHYKLKSYNYYFIHYNPDDVIKMLQLWKSSDPMIGIGNGIVSYISKMKNYTWSYKFNEQEF
jgi:hypothetical protein